MPISPRLSAARRLDTTHARLIENIEAAARGIGGAIV